jgi:hypothetical protein
MMFNFEVNQHLFNALATSDSRPLVRAMGLTKSRPLRRSGDTFSEITMNST